MAGALLLLHKGCISCAWNVKELSTTFTTTFYRSKELSYRKAGNFGGKIFWRIAENMSFGGIYFGG